MPEYLTPGVYMEEFEIGARPIEGVSTSTAGTLGLTERGPEDLRFVSGFEEFKRIYGDYIPNSYLAHGVQGFFANGGQRCFVGRIVANNAVATTADMGTVNIIASGKGDWGNRIAIKIEPGSQDDTIAPPRNKIKLTVMYWKVMPPLPLVDPFDPANATNQNRREPNIVEVYDNLEANQTSIDYYENRINLQSVLIRLRRLGNNNPPDQALTLLSAIGGATPGSDGGPVDLADYHGRQFILNPQEPDATKQITINTGFLALIANENISIVFIPDHHNVPGLTDEIILHCTQMGDRFAVLHTNPATDSLANVGNLRPPQDTRNAAYYFPWIQAYDPRIYQNALMPPSGHIAGIYAKTDVERGVHKPPANETIQGATGLQYQITKANQALLNPRGVNCLRIFPGRGLRVWGARTCSTNTLWKYINVRRLFLYVEKSIEKGTQWVVFEPNNEKLWARVVATITQFLTGVWRDGALMGTKPEEAFFVKCDRSTMTQDDIDNGRLICVIGIAPVKPAEFVIFRIAQWAGGSAATE